MASGVLVGISGETRIQLLHFVSRQEPRAVIVMVLAETAAVGAGVGVGGGVRGCLGWWRRCAWWL